MTEFSLDLDPLTRALHFSLAELKQLPPLALSPLLSIHHPTARKVARVELDRALYTASLTAERLNALKVMMDEIHTTVSLRRAFLANARAAVTALPAETLLHIFEYLLLSDTDCSEPWTSRFELTQVCSQWRAICRGHSQFWTSLTICDWRQGNIIEELLPLSRDKPLHLVTCPPREPHISLPLDTIPRIASIHFHNRFRADTFPMPANPNLVGLETLSIGSENSWADETRLFYSFHSTWSHVPNLFLFGTGSTSLDNFHRLRHLVLRGMTALQCVDTLSTLPPGLVLQHLQLVQICDVDVQAIWEFHDALHDCLSHAEELTFYETLPFALATCFAPLQFGESKKLTLEWVSSKYVTSVVSTRQST